MKQEDPDQKRPLVPVQHFQRHVARHFEQVALFALPIPTTEGSTTSSNKAAPDQTSDGNAKNVNHVLISSTSRMLSDESSAPSMARGKYDDDETITDVIQAIGDGDFERAYSVLAALQQLGGFGRSDEDTSKLADVICGIEPPHERHAIFKLLFDYGPYSESLIGLQLRNSIVHADVEAAKILLRIGADPTLPSDAGETAIDLARNHNNPEMLACLQAADLNWSDSQSQTRRL